MSYYDQDDEDDYAGEYDALAHEVTAERAAAATQELSRAPSSGGFDLDAQGRWTGRGPAPERPWWCAGFRCGKEARTPDEKLYGLCSSCANRDRDQRERAKANHQHDAGSIAADSRHGIPKKWRAA